MGLYGSRRSGNTSSGLAVQGSRRETWKTGWSVMDEVREVEAVGDWRDDFGDGEGAKEAGAKLGR